MRSGSGSSGPLLIDTHYWLWLEAGRRDRLTAQNLVMIKDAADQGNLYLSVISVWEVAMLESKGRLQLHEGCVKWVEAALALPGLNLAELTASIAVDSNHLPGSFHGDPADRIIVATARTMGARLLTSDKNIRTYGRQHHVLLA